MAEVEILGCECSNFSNLASGKTTKQSSNYADNINKYGAANAIDGNNNGNHTAGHMTHTKVEQNPWWEIDLGVVQNLSSIKLWNRTDCCATRLSNFHVFVSDAPFNSQGLNNTINQGGVDDFHFTGTAGRETDIDLNTTGRYLRIQLDGTKPLQLAEVEIFGCTSKNLLTVSLYKHCAYNGTNIELPVGNYPNITNLNFLNDDLSSIIIPTGFQVILYQNFSFGGSSITLTSNDNCLVNNNFNDEASSLRIIYTGVSPRLSLSNSEPISIAPNPTSGNLHIDLSNYMNKSIRYMVTSIQGQTMMEGKFEADHHYLETLDLYDVPNGVYILYLRSPLSEPIAVRFVVQKNY